MKSALSDYSLYDIPELEEAEFALAISPCPRIEDCDDIGNKGDSFSIASFVADVPFREFD